ncbi:MAG: hypothetical protein ABR915_05005 [Thermoguttaceae bacterium]|jgi:hypothetical protein
MSSVFWIVVAIVAVSAIISLVTGALAHWPVVIAGIAAGLWFAGAIGR